jgi:hypothetical protein
MRATPGNRRTRMYVPQWHNFFNEDALSLRCGRPFQRFLAAPPRRDTRCCGEQSGKPVRSVIRRRFVPALSANLTRAYRQDLCVGHTRLNNLDGTLTIAASRELATRMGAQRLTRSLKFARNAFRTIQHVEPKNLSSAISSVEQIRKVDKSLIRRLFVPCLAEKLTDTKDRSLEQIKINNFQWLTSNRPAPPGIS